MQWLFFKLESVVLQVAGLQQRDRWSNLPVQIVATLKYYSIFTMALRLQLSLYGERGGALGNCHSDGEQGIGMYFFQHAREA